MARRQKKKKQNITLDELRGESTVETLDSKEANIVESTKDKNITLDDIVVDLPKKNEPSTDFVVPEENEGTINKDENQFPQNNNELSGGNLIFHSDTNTTLDDLEKIKNDEVGKMENDGNDNNDGEGNQFPQNNNELSEGNLIFHNDTNTTLDDLEKFRDNEEGKIENDEFVNKDDDNSIFHQDTNTTLNDLEKINNEEGMDKDNDEFANKDDDNPIFHQDTNTTLNDLEKINNEEGMDKDNDKKLDNNEEGGVDNLDENRKGGINNEEITVTEDNISKDEGINNTENNTTENNTEEAIEQTSQDNAEDNAEVNDQNNQEISNNSGDDKTQTEPEKNKNSSDGENNKGDIALDNLGDHINNENMNVINVNDEKYSINTTTTDGDKGENNGEESQEAQSSTEGNGELIENGEGDEEGVNLDEINIAGIDENGELQLDLSGGSLYDIQKTPRVRTGKITVFSVLICIISIIIGVLAYFYNDFITHDLTNIEENRAYTFVETAKDFVSKYKKGENTNTIQSINLIGKNGKYELDNLIEGDLNYIQKKEILDEAVSKLSNNIISKYSRLNEIRNDITRYGFFPKDLSNIISESEPISSIQNSLVALEAIKFSSAISVFSYLDTFTTSLVQSLGIDRDEVEKKVGDITNRGESDINIYIKNCYLNPFEGDYDCDYIGDFDEYYKKLNDNFDTEFFKELIKYTDSRLEQSEIPSFAISFKEFNQKDNEITFDIEINTLKEDEAELTKKGILSPHIFILNSLINSLRQSRFIVGDDISVKTLNVMPNTYIIGMSEINVNRSVNTFTVHIKKENAVEIDDFVYMDY